MRVVMLHRNQWHIAGVGKLVTALGGKIIRVGVDGDNLRPVIKQRGVELQVVAVVALGARVFQIAHVLGDDGLAVLQ